MKIKSTWNKFLLCVISIILLSWGYLIGKIYYYSNVDIVQKADAIVVLGASQWDGKPSPVFQSRLDHAYSLYQNHLGNNLILAGGIGKGEEFSEAMIGRIYLLEKGINQDNIFIEERGKTSKESLDEVAKIIETQNFSSIILVSDGFHMMRLKKMASDLDIKTFTSPVINGPINQNLLSQSKYYIRESVVYVLYLMFGI